MLERVINSDFLPSIFLHIGLIVASIFTLAIYLTWKDERVWKHFRIIGGPYPLPFIGNALSLFRDHDWLLKNLAPIWVTKYGRCFCAWIGNAGYVVIVNAMDAEKILSSNVIVNKGRDYHHVHKWLRTGLLTAPREKWFHRRKLLTPAFHFKILEDFLPVFNEHAKILNKMLEKQIQKSSLFDITTFITKCTLDVISETAMGVRMNIQAGGDTEYAKAVCGMTDVLVVKGINPLYRIEFFWNLTPHSRVERNYLNLLQGFTDSVIKSRKNERLRQSICEEIQPSNVDSRKENHGQKKRRAFLDLLLDVQDSEENFTDLDVREEVDTFMFEGHDTTAANINWTILMIALHPKCQARVHEELDGIFGNDKDREIGTSDLTQLKYLECCIKETLRLFPSVPFFLRSADQDIPLDDKRIVPKGSSVFISPYILHRDPSVFPSPEKYDPERFTTENSIGRHPYAFVPFSAGPRNCIGQKFALMEEKIILATFLRKFCLESVDTLETVVQNPDIILRPKYGIKVKLIKRS